MSTTFERSGAARRPWPGQGEPLSRLVRRGEVEIVAADTGDGSPRARVVVEHTDGAVRYAAETILAEEGFAVAGCGGRTAFRRARCPLMTSGSCPLVDGVDVVVHALNSDYALNARLLETLKACYPNTPIVVEAPGPTLERHAELFAGCHLISSPMTRERLVAAVAAAATDPGPRGTGGRR